MSNKSTPAMSAAPMSDGAGSGSTATTAHAAAAPLSVPSAESVVVVTHSAPGQEATTLRPRRSDGVGRETRSLRRADTLIARGETDKALAHLRKLVAAMPDSTRGHLRIASLLREKHRSAEALEVLRSAVTRAPDAPSAREALAEICLEVGRWDEAIQHSRALLAIMPRSLFARDVLSAAYLQRGHIDDALRIIDQMIQLDPLDAANHFKRGVLLQQKGHIGAAVQAFTRVLRMDPDSEAAEESRAALEMLDSYQIRQIITLAVEDIPFRLLLGQSPAEAVIMKGFLLSEAGLSALSQIHMDDLPDAPPGWRQYHYH